MHRPLIQLGCLQEPLRVREFAKQSAASTASLGDKKLSCDEVSCARSLPRKAAPSNRLDHGSKPQFWAACSAKKSLESQTLCQMCRKYLMLASEVLHHWMACITESRRPCFQTSCLTYSCTLLAHLSVAKLAPLAGEGTSWEISANLATGWMCAYTIILHSGSSFS